MSTLLVARRAMVAALVVAACGSDDGDTAPRTDVSGLFVVSADDLTAEAAAMTDIAQRMGEALKSFDAADAPPTDSFLLIDPAIPSLRMHSMGDYLSFMEATIDTTHEVGEILVNRDGSLTATDWTSFFHADVAGIDGGMPFARQLRVTDGSVTQLMHLMGAADAADHAEAIARTIGYEQLGVPLDEAVATIEAEAAQASDLAERWATAWTTRDLDAIRALYAAAGAVRVDGYAGGEKDVAAVEAWATTLFAATPDLAVTVTDVFASGMGPGVIADMTATVDGTSCTVRIGVVWETGEDGLVTREYVYYDANALLACGWVR